MGILDSIASSVARQVSDDPAKQAQILLGWKLLRDYGGVDGLLERFRSSGFSAQVDSWLAVGDNIALKPEDIRTVFGAEGVTKMASEFELPESQVMSRMAKHLPLVIDKLSPDGKLPGNQAAMLMQGLRLFKS
ncbi:DUF937 domain-containing protein [Pseudomethylobacillus aquaticus]|uniref:DUF937 domain-containing protein n=1 Tax=Pseudomethylobacillus aquaticus TaxID=2676064 RepID=A0A3N0V387_9PROT|nr:YidB family protein [Pseudomethylobacillus aquaticus]ROH87001.1 DUF937 domain-containing protein [Pseudomethylobacillus aquaticus]